MDKELIYKIILIFTKNILKILISLTAMIIISMLYFLIFNKNYTIIFLYLGIGVCILLGKIISRFLKFINNNKEYESYYKQILNTVVSNFTKKYSNYIWIMPNLFLLIISFIYSYLLLSYSFSKKLNNIKEIPSIITYFLAIIIIYSILFVTKCLFYIKYERNIKWFNFILNVGIYNTLFSLILGIIIGFLYFNLMKTFYRSKLFFQPHMVCKDSKCFYDPIKSYWFYSYT